jgi:hypothetical protein
LKNLVKGGNISIENENYLLGNPNEFHKEKDLNASIPLNELETTNMVILEEFVPFSYLFNHEKIENCKMNFELVVNEHVGDPNLISTFKSLVNDFCIPNFPDLSSTLHLIMNLNLFR